MIRRPLFIGIGIIGMALVVASGSDAATLRVCAAGCAYSDLQQAIDAAAPGDTILLRAGETFTGHFILRRKAGDARIVIRSDAADSELPAPGTRLVPSGRAGANTSLSRLARLRGRGGSWRTTPVVRTEAGAHHYTLRFLQIDGSMQEGYETLVSLGGAAYTSLDQMPHAIVLDRVYVHGHPYQGQKRCLALNSGSTEIRESYFADCKSFTNDAQAIAGWNGPGPYLIENNYLEGSGENIAFGGADPRIRDLVPSDIRIRRNHIAKPLAWKSPMLARPSGVQAAASATAGSLAGGTHYFRVVAMLSSAGSLAHSLPSAEVAVAVTAGTSALVRWTPVPGATSYRVYRGTRAGGQQVYTGASGAASSLLYTGAGERAGTPPSSATYWAVKNLLQLKNAQRVLIEGNVIENVWTNAQNGYAILFTPRNQDNTAPWSVVRDVTVRYNLVRRANGGINVLGYDYSASGGSQVTRRITIAHNVFEEIGTASWGGGGHVLMITRSPSDVHVDHNTILQANNLVAIDDGTSTGFVFRNNMTRHNAYGIFGSGAGYGTQALNAYFPGAIVRRNVFADGPSWAYPPDNWFPSLATMLAQFVSAGTGDYRLAAGSPWRGAGTDGRDIGADVGTLLAVQGGAAPPPAGGDPAPAPPPSSPGDGQTGTGAPEIVLTAADVTLARGHWRKVASAGSPGGVALASSDTGWSQMQAPVEEPAHYFEAVFKPVPNVPYRLWVRMRSPSIASDSVWVQFTGAVDASGMPLWRTGTTAGLQVLQSPCSGCASSGWGWEENGWWVDAPSIVRFPSAAPQTVRVQSREDGVMVDTIVLSPAKYLSSPPGPQSHDTTVLARAGAPIAAGDIVLRTEDVVRRNGNWAPRSDASAAGGRVLRSEDRGWYTATPLPSPHNVVEFTFTAVANVRYRVWFRLSADRNWKENDSIWAQFTRTNAADGSPIYRLGSTSAVLVNLEACAGCGLSGWGWADGAFWTGQTGTIRFTTTGMQRLRVQTREDGVRLDQIVISPDRYLFAAPGATDGDTTIVPR